MTLIFNANELGVTEQQMKTLYRNNLILCNDYTLTVATVPGWARKEAETLTGIDFMGTIVDDTYLPSNKIDVMLKNRYDYPKLFESIWNSRVS